MKFLLFLVVFLMGCAKDPIFETFEEISFPSQMRPMDSKMLSTFSTDPAVRFEWKGALVSRLLEEEVEKKITKVSKKRSDLFMGQAESELTEANGIIVSGMVFYFPKDSAIAKENRGVVMDRVSQIADGVYQRLSLDPSPGGLQIAFQNAKKDLPKGVNVNLRVRLKVLGPNEVQTPGWIFLLPLLDAHKKSKIDQVSRPVKVGDSLFVTLLRARVESEVLPVSVIRKRADELALAEMRRSAISAVITKAIGGVSLEVFPETIQKEGSVK